VYVLRYTPGLQLSVQSINVLFHFGDTGEGTPLGEQLRHPPGLELHQGKGTT